VIGAELGMDWRGTGGAVTGWDGCRPYLSAGGPASQMSVMNGVVQQRRQLTYNAAAGVTGYGASDKPEYARTVPPKYVTSIGQETCARNLHAIE